LYKKAEVTDEQGKKYAKEIGAEWRSTSSLLDDYGIDDLVDVLFNKYLQEKLNKNESFSAKGTIVIKNKNNDENERKSGCCGGKKDKRKIENKNTKNVVGVEINKENNEKYSEDDDF
jgi:hypothetical protein